MKQRLHIARSLLTDPEVLFLDEPTLGVDPVGARDLRKLILDLRTPSRTILLTTHYMFEADSLCDHLAIINRGHLIAEGTPAEIKRSAPELEVIEVEVFGALGSALERIKALEPVNTVTVERQDQIQRVRVHCRDASALLGDVVQELGDEARVGAATVRAPSLEDAYIGLLEQGRNRDEP
jgi:ABC-2 type transport system ATP-binding protein